MGMIFEHCSKAQEVDHNRPEPKWDSTKTIHYNIAVIHTTTDISQPQESCCIMFIFLEFQSGENFLNIYHYYQ